MVKKNKNILTGIFVLIIIVVIVVIVFVIVKGNEKKDFKNIQNKKKVVNVSINNVIAEIKNDSINEAEIKKCDDTGNPLVCKTDNIINAAVETNDIKTCDYFKTPIFLKKSNSDVYAYNNCIRNLVDKLINETADDKYCDLLNKKEKKYCLENVKYITPSK